MKNSFNDPYLDVMYKMSFMSNKQLEILRDYATKLQAAYAAKEKERGEETFSTSK